MGSSRGRRRGRRSYRCEPCAKAREDSEELRHSQAKDKRAKMEDRASGAKSAERVSPESDWSRASPHNTVNSSRLADEHADMLVMQRRQHLEEARRRLEAEYERVKASETEKCRREAAERHNMEELSELHRKRQAERKATERMVASRRGELAKASASIPTVITGVDSEVPPRGDSEDAGGSVTSESASEGGQQLHDSVQPDKHSDEMANSEVPASKVAVMESELPVPCKSQQQSEPDHSEEASQVPCKSQQQSEPDHSEEASQVPCKSQQQSEPDHSEEASQVPCKSQQQSEPDHSEEASHTRVASPIDANDVATNQHTSMAMPPVASQTNVAALTVRTRKLLRKSMKRHQISVMLAFLVTDVP